MSRAAAGRACQATSTIIERTLFFIDPLTGETKGTMLHPRPQTSRENCTWHNFNVIPTKAGYYATVGSYQSGISVFDFTNPATPREIAYADPAPLQTRRRAAHHGHHPRRRLVDLLAQRLHLRVRHQARRHHMAPEPRPDATARRPTRT